ncbi:glycine oxidase ThiO [uncultured Prochlorococcus sp.]|uniref:glycine oxidase ThiO n=1 Tax=uncultured Prochlorococcus sp. TaxID=159733 RepID=UPI002586CCBA|nr:glycine oxidase ThiO [uncultured Prochlorococcus sp.]
MTQETKNSILIIGGGLIGLSIAYEFARNNFKVLVLSKNRGESAGFVAAGMLAAHAEGLENELLKFGQASQSLIPKWIKSIEKDSDMKCGLKKCGIVVPFTNKHELEEFPTYKYGSYLNQKDLQTEINGINSIWKYGLLFEQDGQIDNRRRLMRALERACSLHGVKFQEGSEVKDLKIEENKIIGATVLNATGELKKITCDKAILCSGAWSKKIFNKIPVFPIKGQMLSIQGPTNFLKRIIFGPKTYLVPRDDGLIVVGATVEKDSKFQKGNTPYGIKQLQEGIRSLLPEATNWPQMEHWWGFRPCTPDLKPILGESKIENLFLATGHYRNGVLFSAITSDLLLKLVQKKDLKEIEIMFLKKFCLDRFEL